MDRPGPGGADGRPDHGSNAVAAYAFSTRALDDGTFAVESVSDALDRDFDVAAAARTRLGMLGLAHQLDVSRAEEAQAALRSGREVVAELRLTTRAGTLVWTRFCARPVADPGTGRLVRVDGAFEVITARKQAEHRLARSIEQLRQAEEDRRRLLARLAETPSSQGLHGEGIDAVTRRLAVLGRELADARQAAVLRETAETLGQAVDRLRHLLAELRPPELDGEGLAASVWAYMEQARADAGIEYRLENRLRIEPDEGTRLAVYRILQEALANVRKHARADHVEVLIESREGGVFVRVWDDGLGFAKQEVEPPRPGKLGIPSMRERAEAAGGWCQVDSLPALGTRVEYWLPMAPGAEPAARGDGPRELLPQPWSG